MIHQQGLRIAALETAITALAARVAAIEAAIGLPPPPAAAALPERIEHESAAA
jgi:hypothetical protein